jgi:hypothetical protein
MNEAASIPTAARGLSLVNKTSYATTMPEHGNKNKSVQENSSGTTRLQPYSISSNLVLQ